MSLLMQALKKAERAKQNALSEDELDRPSAAFDGVLALTPAPAHEFSLEPMDGLSLEPLAPPVAATPGPRPSPSPLPPVSDHQQPGLTMDLVPDPVAAPPAPAPAAAQLPPVAAPSAAAAAPHAPAPASSSPHPAAGTAAAAAAPAATASAQTSASDKAGNTAAGARPRTAEAARARVRTNVITEPSGLDPERLRLFSLIAVLVLLVGGFGIYYWRALTAPGAGASLPPVPMPPAGATGASPGPGQLVIANGVVAEPAAAAGVDTAPGAGDADLMMAPGAGSSRTQQELERRIARTEQELAAAQQAIQAAAQPRAEQMPVLAAPPNNDIRVTRMVQPAPVSPTLDGAYQAFNSGDTVRAQQQYDAALAQDANNRDALLGAAHVAARQNLKDKAAGYYLRLLELAPNDADATAGLIGLRQGDISQSEARLKGILANNPEAGPVLFALGNLYAQQGRWADAQQAYFRAVGAAPDNPDYVYNLAIGLDRLNQGKLALSHYQRALVLAQDKAVGFERNALRKRMHELTTAAH
ncbi:MULTISPECIES: lipopolysaccharide assembly protein LapB [unclassified Duganella]|uniref:tetratricopeptide repeat protein n=1 Tax=unclassified Duganella TaxID=2636909 RepID=UPI00088E6268|nr:MULTISPECIES: tetratricopeptide repeat protein [unclassified Duganella]SDG54725.1 Tfp pilus assembly protein PilF [Duganella sp. OV458]SDJ77379.1 Tfp pilus assembly protein PilF [Duganella sp. OV510]